MLDEILKGTSRAFYLSLSVLPPLARAPLSLAYLIARAADTIADAPGPLPSQRREALLALKSAVLSRQSRLWNPDSEILQELCPEVESEALLLRSIPKLLELLNACPLEEQEASSEVVSTLIDGMLFDQEIFDVETAPGGKYGGLTDEELETYTYLVAGCVGPFWSRVCALSHPKLAHLTDTDYHEMSVEFGKALQWVNILRDIPKDQSLGRFYLPHLQDPTFPGRFTQKMRRALDAIQHASGYPYLFPNAFLRYRLSVFWPLVLALRTLEKLARDGGPQQGRRVKVPRWEVMLWLALGSLLVLNNSLLSYVLQTLKSRAEHALTLLEEQYESESSLRGAAALPTELTSSGSVSRETGK